MKIIQTKKLKAKRENPNRYRVYDPKGIAPCLNTMGGGGSAWLYHGTENMDVFSWADGWNCFRRPDGTVSRENEIDGKDFVAWMPLPTPYKGGDDE